MFVNKDMIVNFILFSVKKKITDVRLNQILLYSNHRLDCHGIRYTIPIITKNNIVCTHIYI